MRYVFMDEAGTSALEPVTVVVALITHADEHLMSAETAVSEALGAVPLEFRDKFVFHATSVFGDRKYQNTWLLGDRIELLKAMMSIPRRIGMGLTVSLHWRGSVDYGSLATNLGLSSCQFDHLQAFTNCVAISDRSIRKHAGPREVATIVAEDVPEMRKYLKLVPKRLRDNPIMLSKGHIQTTPQDKELGYTVQGGDLRVSRIRNSVHFVEKSDDPLVQIADACAYGIRRYFANEKFGEDFARSITGDLKLLRNFSSPMGAECFWFGRSLYA